MARFNPYDVNLYDVKITLNDREIKPTAISELEINTDKYERLYLKDNSHNDRLIYFKNSKRLIDITLKNSYELPIFEQNTIEEITEDHLPTIRTNKDGIEEVIFGK